MDMDNSVIINEEQQTDLLEKLEKLEKKQLMYARVRAFLMLVIVVVVLVLLPRVTAMVDLAVTTMNNMNDIMGELSNTVDIMDETLLSVEKLSTDGSDGIADALGKVEEIDIDGLNSAIKDLQDVVEPLAKFFNKF